MYDFPVPLGAIVGPPGYTRQQRFNRLVKLPGRGLQAVAEAQLRVLALSP
jgi:hypothetical protein